MLELTNLYFLGSGFAAGLILGFPAYRYLQKREAEKLEALAKAIKALGEKAQS